MPLTVTHGEPLLLGEWQKTGRQYGGNGGGIVVVVQQIGNQLDEQQNIYL